MYKKFEDQYFDAINNILQKGIVCVSGRQTTDKEVTRTKRVWGTQFNIDLQKEYPLMQAKHVAVKSAIREILWIMQKQSNSIKDLRPHIWDKWADENGCIGKTYGYNVGKVTRHNWWVYPSQVHFVLGLLGKDPSSRHCVIDMWDCETLNEQNCIPCCYSSHWAILDGKLNVMVTQRSADMMVGLPFNIAQYAFLCLAFARHLGVGPGMYIHNISDAHIYENQFGNFDTGEGNAGFSTLMDNHNKVMQGLGPITSRDNFKPEVIFPESTSFWDITDDNFDVEGYKIGTDCFEDITFEVTK